MSRAVTMLILCLAMGIAGCGDGEALASGQLPGDTLHPFNYWKLALF